MGTLKNRWKALKGRASLKNHLWLHATTRQHATARQHSAESSLHVAFILVWDPTLILPLPIELLA
jgi:hypothetical protein